MGYRCDAPERSGPGPTGVAVVDGTVYGETPTSVFALSAATGKRVWVNAHVLTGGEGTFGIQPQVADGRVYLASQYGPGPGDGVLIALNATTGAVLWRFNTAVGPDPGVRALGLGTGGAWETPLVTVSNDLVFTTTLRELVALNRRTGMIVLERKLPTTSNSPIAIAGNTLIVPAGGVTGRKQSRDPQVVAYMVR